MTRKIPVERLMNLPGGDELGPREPATDDPVRCEACGFALPLDAPPDAHDHDFAGAITVYGSGR